MRCASAFAAGVILTGLLGCHRPELTMLPHSPLRENDGLRALRLPPDARVDDALQTALVAADERVRGALGIAAEQRAFGVVDLTSSRIAWLNPDKMFYGASVPKICIVLAYFARQPQRATQLDPATELELQRVIKRSDNELAAKYSQIVGLDAIQELLRSEAYRFYDPHTGGGLWCGKHYGIDAPRVGDPVADLSHAVTVRQCLRYYLMMEQGLLVNPRVCRRLFDIFAAPRLDFHDDRFVRGLNGRDVTLIRKSGLWEDWHLDTARVVHGDRVYLLAGAVRHAQGNTYLARMAAAVDDELVPGDGKQRRPTHRLHLLDDATAFRAAAQLRHAKVDGHTLVLHPQANTDSEFVSSILAADEWFNNALVSWNIDSHDPAARVVIELRVGREADDSWSPWLYVGGVGAARAPDDAVTSFDGGRIDVDYFRSDERYDRAQVRVRALHPADGRTQVRVARIAVCLSDLSGIPTAMPVQSRQLPATVSPSAWRRRLGVPFRSQKTEHAEIAGRICSPTSLAMVMAYRGVDRPTSDVAAAAYDPLSAIYGNWPSNIQAAFEFGVPGYLRRFSDWADVETAIAADQPLIISIRVRNPGDLKGAPYETTDGHLIVLTGFADNGDAWINDPAASTAKAGVVRYTREDLERVWMRGSGGLAYVLLPADTP